MTLTGYKQKLLVPSTIAIIWGVMIFISVLLRAVHGPVFYNNFMIFRGAAHHLFSSLPLYGEYPSEYLDMNHYGPFFGMLIAPFAWLPSWLGLALWVGSMAAFLYWAVRQLPLPPQTANIVLLLMVNDLYNAGLMQQFNIATAALIVGSLAMIQQRREGWAALFIVVGTFVKVYGIVGLAFFFFAERKWRFIEYTALWSLVVVVLPLLVVTPEYLITQYTAWITDIVQKNGENMFCEYTNISLIGAVRKISGSASYSDLALIVPALLMFLASYLRVQQFRQPKFQLLTLGSVLMFTVLFSSGSENSGYIIATTGAGIWWATLPPGKSRLTWMLLILMLMASFSYNIFSWNFYHGIVYKYALRAIPYTLIWLHCTWRLWTENFSQEESYRYNDRLFVKPNGPPEKCTVQMQ